VYSASLETIRREPREFDLRRSVVNQQDQVTGNTRTESFSARSAKHKSHKIAAFRFLHFLCTRCAEYALPGYEIVPRPPLHSENLSATV